MLLLVSVYIPQNLNPRNVDSSWSFPFLKMELGKFEHEKTAVGTPSQ
jgi:hypothetical protein